MTTILERLTTLRIVQVLAAAAVAALFVVAGAGMAAAQNYPTTDPPPATASAPATPSVRVVGQPTSLPLTGGDAIGLAVLGVGVAGAGAGLVIWSRRRTAESAPV